MVQDFLLRDTNYPEHTAPDCRGSIYLGLSHRVHLNIVPEPEATAVVRTAGLRRAEAPCATQSHKLRPEVGRVGVWGILTRSALAAVAGPRTVVKASLVRFAGNAAWGSTAAAGAFGSQGFGDGFGDLFRIGSHFGVPAFEDGAVASDQKLAEIPFHIAGKRRILAG
jgi:hypothetical protein